MRIRTVFAVALLMVLSSFTLSQEKNTSLSCEYKEQSEIAWRKNELLNAKSSHVIVIAHRACWENVPENSLAAIQACIGLGADMIEIDVRKSADNELVVIHDETLDRTTNGSGHVGQFTRQQLQKFHLRNRAGGVKQAVTDQKIPTLAEVLQLVSGKCLSI